MGSNRSDATVCYVRVGCNANINCFGGGTIVSMSYKTSHFSSVIVIIYVVGVVSMRYGGYSNCLRRRTRVNVWSINNNLSTIAARMGMETDWTRFIPRDNNVIRATVRVPRNAVIP
jgi:hypothetical protein